MITLSNVGTSYDATGPSKGLGFAEIDLSGATQVVCKIKYQKIGTGTLTWQLWNATDGVELGKFDDAALAADNKVATITVNSGIPSGVKELTVRVKSTVATDDPVFYGANIRVVK